MDPARIEEAFPAPSYRGNQAAALEDIRAAFEAGNDVVLVRAPTGSGKSLLARSVMGCARTPDEAAPSDRTGAFYTTPQVSQLDDVAEDPLLEDLQVVRGKSNYTCILRGEEDTPVNRAPCAREQGYDCSVKHRCPYFSDRAIAANREHAAMTLAYFMRTAGSEVFGARDVVVVDEAHGLAEWAEMYAAIDLTASTVPIWEDVELPESTDLDRVARFAEQLADACERAKADLLGRDLSPAEAARRDRLAELRSELTYFVEDYRNPDSTTTWVVDADDRGLTIKPLNPARYLAHTVWDRGNRFALFSATILDKASFCRGVGLDPADVALVDVDHTFPLENRPLYDVTCGKMTYEERDSTLPDLARVVSAVMDRHPGEKGLIHAHSYGIQRRLVAELRALDCGDRLHVHGRNDRDAELAAWQARDDPAVFVSVKMEEALDLAGDLARFQVVCKAPFASTGDARVERRLADGQWAWYYRTALRTVIQACGRVVRSPDDHGATYLADSSLLDLFERARSDMPAWFAEQVDAVTRPNLDLPEPHGTSTSGAGAPGADSARADAGGDSTADAAGAETENDRDAAADPADDPGSTSTGDADGTRSPMADVWDPE